VKLHFKIIRSKYQKGRLMVNWDPNGSLNASGLETALYTKIFDLASPEQGFDFVIPYKAATPWLVSRGRLAFSTSSPGYSMESTNGNWQLSVVNALTGPVADATVTVCFMSLLVKIWNSRHQKLFRIARHRRCNQVVFLGLSMAALLPAPLVYMNTLWVSVFCH
jgi:hypothetical protein